MTLDKDTFNLAAMTDDQRKKVEAMTFFLHNYAIKEKIIINGLFVFSDDIGWNNHLKSSFEDFVDNTRIMSDISTTAVDLGFAGMYSVRPQRDVAPEVYESTSLVRVSFARGKWW